MVDGTTQIALEVLLSARELPQADDGRRIQSHAPEAVDITAETEATRKLYGLDQKYTSEFGTRCLLARRLVERGVRFVQIYSGGGPVSVQWDAHSNLVANHEKMCGMTDLPVAGLLRDLKQRIGAAGHADLLRKLLDAPFLRDKRDVQFRQRRGRFGTCRPRR